MIVIVYLGSSGEHDEEDYEKMMGKDMEGDKEYKAEYEDDEQNVDIWGLLQGSCEAEDFDGHDGDLV